MPQEQSFWSQLPSSPGIYIFEDGNHTALYIGKAINIRTRIKQELEGSRFVPKTSYLRIRQTVNDLEAIVLESYLIKTIYPPFNIRSKDDKSDIYLTISDLPTPVFQTVRSTDINLSDYKNPDTQVYGPYNSAYVAKNLLKVIRRIFGYCQNPFNPNQRACFYYHLHQCPGPCLGIISQKEYLHHLTNIKRFLSGQFIFLRRNLTKEIKSSAKAMEFETAAKLKHQLENLEKALSLPQLSGFLEFPEANIAALNELVRLLDHPWLQTPPHRIECYDIAHLQQDQTVGGMSVLVDGTPTPSQYRRFIIHHPHEGDPASLREIISRRLHHFEWPKPDLIVLDGGVGQLSIVSPVVPSQIPLIALSKKRETIHFYQNGDLTNLNIPPHKPSLKLLQTIRDEAHRFTTSFHSRRRRIAILKS